MTLPQVGTCPVSRLYVQVTADCQRRGRKAWGGFRVGGISCRLDSSNAAAEDHRRNWPAPRVDLAEGAAQHGPQEGGLLPMTGRQLGHYRILGKLGGDRGVAE